MKITLLTSAFENVASYFRAFNLGKNLAGQGHTVNLFGQINAIKAVNKVVNNVNVYLLPSFSNSKTFNKSTAMFSIPLHTSFNALSTIISKTDVLHAFDVVSPQTALPVLLSKLKSQKTRPLIFVDWDEWWGRGGILDVFHKDLSPILLRSLTFFEEKIPAYGDAVTVLNGALKKRAMSVGIKPEKIIVIPNGTNMELYHDISEQTAREYINFPKNAIIYTCTKSSFDPIIPYNDPLWDLLIAHNEVTKKFHNTCLAFLGRESERCVELARKFDLGRNVISLGWQPPDKYFNYLVASDFFLIPLKSYNYYFDASRVPLRLLDYMALGKLVLATDLPEIRNILKDYGLLARPNDPRDLAGKMINIIENLDSWKQIAEKSKEKIRKDYSWKNIAKELENNYYSFSDRMKH